MKAKYIPVNNNLDKAIAFANTLDSNNIKNIQKLKQPQHYIETLDVVKMLQNEGWELSGVDEFRNKQRKVTSHYLQLHHNDFQIVTKGKTDAVASITLSNSCDGKKPLVMSLGAYRQVCSNGMIAHVDFATERFRHIQVDYNNLVNKINLFGNKVDTKFVLGVTLPNRKEKVLKQILDILIREPNADYFWFHYKGELTYTLPADYVQAVPGDAIRVDKAKIKSLIRDIKLNQIGI